MSSPIQVSPQIRITMADEDVTSHYVVDKGMNVELTTDFPTYAAFTTSSLTLHLDNSNLEFDPNNSSNFFTRNNYPQHGRRVPVLVELSITNNDFSVVFAGQIDQVKTTLEDTIAEILVVDLSIRFRNNEVRNYGEQVRSFNINSIQGANSQYAQFSPQFLFPSKLFPISKGSVDVETPDGVTIVPSVRTEGFELSYENAEISHDEGIITFEAEPEDEEEQDVTVSWKYILRYKRPDSLVWMLLKNVNFYDELGYSNDTIARATIPKATLRHPDSEQFSSHGRIGFEQNIGVVRWMKRGVLSNNDHIDNQSPFWYFAADANFIEYDEYQDSYKVLSSVGQGTDIERIVSSGTYDNDQQSLSDPSDQSHLIFNFTGSVSGEGYIHVIGERPGFDRENNVSRDVRVSEKIEIDGTGTYRTKNSYNDEIFYTVVDVSGGQLSIDAEPLSPWVIMQFDTVDFNTFYFLTTNDFRADSTDSRTEIHNRIYRYVLNTDTWTLIASEEDEFVQIAHESDMQAGYMAHADNRKSFRVLDINDVQYVYYMFAEPNANGGIKRYDSSNDTHTIMFDSQDVSNPGNSGVDLTYGVDFDFDITPHNRPSSPLMYVFVCYEMSQYNVAFEIHRMSLSGSSKTEIYQETFTGTETPVSATDIILDDDANRWYFVLTYMSSAGTTVGKTELSRVLRHGQSDGTRNVIKTYQIPFHSARSPAHIFSEGEDLRIFYLEGHWLAGIGILQGDPSEYYPIADEAGHLIEINTANDTVIDQGLVWRSAVSPDPGNTALDGFGVHTFFSSNMIQDDRDSLYFISGYGIYVDISDYGIRTDFERVTEVNVEGNYILTQWGKDLSTKIPEFPTNGRNTWSLLELLATLMNWEVGFGVDPKLIERIKSRFPNESDDYGLNANLLFRPRLSIVGKLDSDLSSTSDTLTLVDTPFATNEISNFPEPPSGEVYYIMVNDELMSYNGISDNDITGLERGLLNTTVVSHDEDDTVYLIDYIASNETNFRTLQHINSRTSDFPNIFNSIDTPYSQSIFTSEDQDSIDEHGQSKYIVESGLLKEHDRPWAEILSTVYLNDLSNIRQLIDFSIIFIPDLKVGQIVLLHQPDRINLEYVRLRILRVSHDIKEWKTTVLGREIQ